MTLREMRQNIDIVSKCFPSTKLLVITGGECTLLGYRLLLILAYAHQKGFATRIVTNGHWASSPKRAKRYLSVLKMVGLNEISLSTGKEHAEWVPVENVVNACAAAYSMGMTCAVNIESPKFDRSNYNQFKEIPTIAKIIEEDARSLYLIAGEWIAKEHSITLGELIGKKAPLIPERGCDSIFTTITYAPGSRLYGCCGLSIAKMQDLLLADTPLSDRDLYAEWGGMLNDFLKIWIFVEGPLAIIRFLAQKEPTLRATRLQSAHSCAICRLLFTPRVVTLLAKHYQEKRSEIFLKFSLRAQAAKVASTAMK